MSEDLQEMWRFTNLINEKCESSVSFQQNGGKGIRKGKEDKSIFTNGKGRDLGRRITWHSLFKK